MKHILFKGRFGASQVSHEKRATYDQMAGWHEFEQTLGDSKGQGSLLYCTKSLLTTQQLSNNNAAKSLQSHVDYVRAHRWQPTRLPRPWDSPGKNTGVGCHFLLQRVKGKSESEVAQSCPTLSNPMDCSPPGSSTHGFSRQQYLSCLLFQATVPELPVVPGNNSKVALMVKNLPANAGDIRDMGLIPVSGIFLKEGIATHSSLLACRIP